MVFEVESMNTVEVIFDGRVFVPTSPLDLPSGTMSIVVISSQSVVRTAMSPAEAERILEGDGTPLPWATVEEALGRPRYQP
jgi:hypothetical protein